MARSNNAVAALVDISKLDSITATLRTLVTGDAANRYEICSLLYTVREARLYEQKSYTSFGEWVRKELGMSDSHAFSQARMFENFKYFNVGRTEAIKLLKEFGITHVYNAFQKAESKPTRKSIADMKENGYDDGSTLNQLNFMLKDKVSEKKIYAALKRHGMEVDENGRRTGMVDALLSLVKAAK